ncbi:MAG: hypothetical protein PHH26_00360 [Candidatus Thermoplasmatota archaeon]|nr:hypothetical protein [Candidatus Thermoplasmatota archaeon]
MSTKRCGVPKYDKLPDVVGNTNIDALRAELAKAEKRKTLIRRALESACHPGKTINKSGGLPTMKSRKIICEALVLMALFGALFVPSVLAQSEPATHADISEVLGAIGETGDEIKLIIQSGDSSTVLEINSAEAAILARFAESDAAVLQELSEQGIELQAARAEIAELASTVENLTALNWKLDMVLSRLGQPKDKNGNNLSLSDATLSDTEGLLGVLGAIYSDTDDLSINAARKTDVAAVSGKLGDPEDEETVIGNQNYIMDKNAEIASSIGGKYGVQIFFDLVFVVGLGYITYQNRAVGKISKAVDEKKDLNNRSGYKDPNEDPLEPVEKAKGAPPQSIAVPNTPQPSPAMAYPQPALAQPPQEPEPPSAFKEFMQSIPGIGGGKNV